MTNKQLLNQLALENVALVFKRYTIKGRFRGQDFEADYDSYDGWAAGNGIQAQDKRFEDTEEFEKWYDDLEELLDTIDVDLVDFE